MSTVPPPPGAPQQQPVPQAPGPRPGTDLGTDLGAALSFAGRSLLRNPAAFLVAGVVYGLLTLIVVGASVAGLVAYMVSAMPSDPYAEPELGMFVAAYAIMFGILLLLVPIMLLWESGTGRAGELILEGARPSIGQALVGPGRVILTALLMGVIVTIGTFLLYLPGLVASIAFFYAIPAAARGASPVEALKQSVRLVRANLGTTIVAWLVLSVIGSVAGSLIITVIALVPFTILFQLGMFERLSGRELPDLRSA